MTVMIATWLALQGTVGLAADEPAGSAPADPATMGPDAGQDADGLPGDDPAMAQEPADSDPAAAGLPGADAAMATESPAAEPVADAPAPASVGSPVSRTATLMKPGSVNPPPTKP
jgi:hypothetical protein